MKQTRHSGWTGGATHAAAVVLLCVLAVPPARLAFAASSFVTPPTVDATAPVISAGPTVVSVTDTTAIIRWVTDEIADSRVEYGVSALTEFAIDTRRVTEHFVTLTNLAPNTAYSYRVLSTDPSANSVTGTTLGFTTESAPDTTAPAFLTGPLISALAATSVQVGWSTDEPATWVLHYGPSAGALTQQVAGEAMATAPNVTLTNLVPGGQYSARVSVWDVAGNLGTSTTASFTTLPAVPTGIAVVTSPGAYTLSWAPAQGASAYNIYRARQGGVTQANYAALTGGSKQTGATSPLVQAANPGETWHFVVTATNAGGESAESAEVSVTIAALPDTTAPTVPGNVAASPVSAGQVNVTWNAATDEVGVTAYKLYRDTVLVQTLSGSALSYSDTGRTASTTYSYTVAACDAAGNCSAQSASATATTPSGSTYTANLEPGFNLIGNSLNITLDVATVFGNQETPVSGVTPNIVSIWKWNAVDGRWAFYSPQLTVAGIANFAASHGYEVLATLNAGEGYWVNVLNAFTLPARTGTEFSWNGSSFSALPSSFNLIAHSSAVTPSQFNIDVSQTPPASGVVPTDNFVSLWAWDAVAGTWYFYSPLLEASGGLPAVKSYAEGRSYRHFQDFDKTLGRGVGFWVNRP